MLNKIIRFSLQNRLLVLVASVLLLVGGTYTAWHTEVDVFPDLNAPTVVVMTEAGGMAAEEVEQLVTFPIETAVNGATGVRRVRSSSTTGFSVVWVEFDWDTDIYLARQIVSEKLATVGEDLPDNVGNPTLGPQSSILGELLIVGLTADSTSMLDLRTLADWTIRPRLLSTGGVAQVAVLGGDIKEYQVLLHPERMKHYGVTLGEVMEVTRGMNQNTNGGVIYEYGNEYIVRGVVSTEEVQEMARAVIKTVGGAPVTLEDIADVRCTTCRRTCLPMCVSLPIPSASRASSKTPSATCRIRSSKARYSWLSSSFSSLPMCALRSFRSSRFLSRWWWRCSCSTIWA